MAQHFTGASNQFISVLPGSLAGVHGYGCIIAMFRRTSTGGTQNLCWTGTNNNAGSASLALDLGGSDTLRMYANDTGASSVGPTITATDRWFIVVARKNTGTVVARFSLWDSVGQTWAHSNGTGTVADGSGTAAGNFTIGSWTTNFDRYDGDIAAIGIFRQWVPSDADVEALGFLNIQSWLVGASLAPAGSYVLVLDQGDATTFAIDRTGNGSNQINDGGAFPTVSTLSVPLLSYGALEAPERIQAAAGGTATEQDAASTGASNQSSASHTNTETSASSTGLANQSSGLHLQTETQATGSGLANQSSVSVSQTESVAPATGTANTSSASTSVQEGLASSTGSTFGSTTSQSGISQFANGSSQALQSAVSLSAIEGSASATGEAFQETAQQAGQVIEQVALATGAALASSPAVSVPDVLGIGTGTSLPSLVLVGSQGLTAGATGLAFNSQTQLHLNATELVAVGTGTAFNESLTPPIIYRRNTIGSVVGSHVVVGNVNPPIIGGVINRNILSEVED